MLPVRRALARFRRRCRPPGRLTHHVPTSAPLPFGRQSTRPVRFVELSHRAPLLTRHRRIIYPHSYPDFVKSGKTDDDLMDILRKVHLAYLPEREGGASGPGGFTGPQTDLLRLRAGYDVRKEWKDILSGGEKQRVRSHRILRTAWVLTKWLYRADGHGTPLLPSSEIWRTRRVHVGRLHRRRRIDVPACEGRRHQSVLLWCVYAGSHRTDQSSLAMQLSSPSRTVRASSSTTCTSCASQVTRDSGSSPRLARLSSASDLDLVLVLFWADALRSSDRNRSRRRWRRSRLSLPRSTPGRPA